MNVSGYKDKGFVLPKRRENVDENKNCILICEKIKKLRREKKMTQEEVAGISIDVRTLRRIENCETIPNILTLLFIINALSVSIVEFFDSIE